MNNKQPAIIIYQDGTLEQPAPIFSGELRRIGQALIQRADNVLVPPTDLPQPQPQNDGYVPEEV